MFISLAHTEKEVYYIVNIFNMISNANGFFFFHFLHCAQNVVYSRSTYYILYFCYCRAAVVWWRGGVVAALPRRQVSERVCVCVCTVVPSFLPYLSTLCFAKCCVRCVFSSSYSLFCFKYFFC